MYRNNYCHIQQYTDNNSGDSNIFGSNIDNFMETIETDQRFNEGTLHYYTNRKKSFWT